jgi:hypothetical protein
MRLCCAIGLAVLFGMVSPGVSWAQDEPAATTAPATTKPAATSPSTTRAARATPVPAPIVPIYTKDKPPATPKLEELPLKESVSQYGITWTFDKPVHVGQFVNSDFYVVGPVTIKSIDPKPLFGEEVGELLNQGEVHEDHFPGKQARNGSSLNPVLRRAGSKGYNSVGFDSRTPDDRYDPEMFAHLPIQMVPGDSLVSTISRANSQITAFDGQHVDPLKVAAVLTCLAEPVPADAFRPSYCDSKNSKPFLSRNLRRDLLTSLPRVEGMPATLEEYSRKFHKPWIDLADFGFAAPQDNLPHYGQQMAELVGEGSLLLLMDYSPQEKETTLVNFVQVGIDLYGVARAGFVWRAHGGLYAGRKWPIVFAGLMLNDPDMQQPTRKVPGVIFHEDDQVAFGPVTYREKKFERAWGGAKVIFLGHSPYLSKTTEKDEARHWEDGWGLVEVYPPSEWPAKNKGKNSLNASEAYRRSNTGGAWIPEALAARILHVEKIWNHDAFFAYEDRWMTEDDTDQNKAIKEAGYQDMTEKPLGEWPRQGFYSDSRWSPWVTTAWTTYRNNLPPAKDGGTTPSDKVTWK